MLDGEILLYAAEFRPRLLAPQLVTNVIMTDRRMIVRHPNTIFSFFPVGYLVSTAPHSSVESISSGTQLHSRNLLFGALGIIAGLYFLFTSGGFFGLGATGYVMAIVCLSVAALMLSTARTVGVIIHTGGSGLYALARGNQLAEVQNVATNLTRLFLQVEKPRRL